MVLFDCESECCRSQKANLGPCNVGEQNQSNVLVGLLFVLLLPFVDRVVTPGADPPRGCPPGSSRFHNMCVRFGGPCGLGINGGVNTNAVTGSGEINVDIDINIEQTITFNSVTQVSSFSVFRSYSLSDGHQGVLDAS